MRLQVRVLTLSEYKEHSARSSPQDSDGSDLADETFFFRFAFDSRTRLPTVPKQVRLASPD